MSLSACTTPPSNELNEPYQESLKKKCPVNNLPTLAGNTGTDAAIPLKEWPEIYGDCAARHNQLVDEMNQRENLL
ncbi:hypothetical protein AB6D34_08255 [Pectobacterium brasiliense]|nr:MULTISPECIES: hypothetical protein [Pectobacterium]RJL41140.1 hypothetical protein D5083_08925 [Pectobacterium carotovorum]RJL44474.1 hypothetical protein D5081_05605 [Pectobacterium carotovorum]